MTDSLLAEIWAFVKGAVIIYGVIAVTIFVVMLIIVITVARKAMRGF